MAAEPVYKNGPYLQLNHINDRNGLSYYYYDLIDNPSLVLFKHTYNNIPYTLPDIKNAVAGLIKHSVPEAFPVNPVLNMDLYIKILDGFDKLKEIPNILDPLPSNLIVVIRQWLNDIPNTYKYINNDIPQQKLLSQITSLLVHYEALKKDDIPRNSTPSRLIISQK